MFNINRFSARKGFTLVELLVVIIIIGILAGMLLIAVGSASDKAEATKIVNLLRSYKSASLVYYADYGTWPSASLSSSNSPGNGWARSLDAYTDRPLDPVLFYGIEIQQLYDGSEGSLIGIGGKPGSPLAQKGVQKKLEALTASIGLLQSGGIPYTANATRSPFVFIRLR